MGVIGAAQEAVGGGLVGPLLTGALRLLLYAGFVLLIGTTFFFTWLWPEGRAVRSVEHMMTLGALLTMLSTMLLPYAQGMSGWRLFESREGGLAWLRVALVALALAAQPVFVRAARHLRLLATTWMFAVVLTYVLSSDAWGGLWPVLKVVATTAHLFATAAWLGGLLAVAAVLVPATALDALDQVLPKFSVVALVSVVTLILSGAVHAYAVVGSLDVLFHSAYGAMLGVKIVVVAAMLVLGDLGRQYANRVERLDGADLHAAEPHVVRIFALGVGAELALAIGVLVATAALVHAVPAG